LKAVAKGDGNLETSGDGRQSPAALTTAIL
jgi:hypothetical protein